MISARAQSRATLAALLLCGVSCRAAADGRLLGDEIVVVKSARSMSLLRDGEVVKTYKVALGGQPLGRKNREGDEKTPEGSYTVDWRNSQSRFYRSMHISYPNPTDRATARESGTSPGGSIMIHGIPPRWSWVGGLHRLRDWTDGCIAVTNSEIDEIWHAIPNGTPITIRP